MSNKEEFLKFADEKYPACSIPFAETLWAGYQAACETKDIEIERLNAQVAILTDVLTRAEDSLCAFMSDDEWSQSDCDTMHAVNATLRMGRNAFVALRWLTSHDAKVRDDALEKAADWFESAPHSATVFDVRDALRAMKGAG